MGRIEAMKRRHMFRVSSFLILTASLVLPLGILNGAAYLKIGDIKGESTDNAHKEWIDVLSWSWGMSRESGTGGGGAGKATFQDIHITKELDKSTPLLMQACASGEAIPSAEITLTRGSGNPVEYIHITMRDILVSSVSTGGSSGEDRLTENMTLNFSHIRIEYTPQNDDGSPGEPTEFSWNIAENTPG